MKSLKGLQEVNGAGEQVADNELLNDRPPKVKAKIQNKVVIAKVTGKIEKEELAD